VSFLPKSTSTAVAPPASGQLRSLGRLAKHLRSSANNYLRRRGLERVAERGHVYDPVGRYAIPPTSRAVWHTPECRGNIGDI
jgi:hypothetical protein